MFCVCYGVIHIFGNRKTEDQHFFSCGDEVSRNCGRLCPGGNNKDVTFFNFRRKFRKVPDREVEFSGYFFGFAFGAVYKGNMIVSCVFYQVFTSVAAYFSGPEKQYVLFGYVFHVVEYILNGCKRNGSSPGGQV